MSAIDPRNCKISIQQANGEWVDLTPIGPPLNARWSERMRGVPVLGSSTKPRRIRLEPVPGKHGIDYVQDWSQITSYG